MSLALSPCSKTRAPWLCVLLVALAGCGTGSEPRSPGSGGTLVVALQADVDSWNPYTAQDATSAGVLDLLYPRLVLETDDGFEPWLARSWSFSDDGREITFSLRPEARWSDGSAVTCDDVRFTYSIQVDDKLAWPGAFLKERIASVECPDPETAVFRFRAAYPDQILDANDDAIVPAAYRDVPLDAWAATAWHERAVTCGPFRLAEVRPGQEAVLERDPSWWDAATVAVDRVVLRTFPDETAALSRFREGGIHVLPKVPPLAAATVESDPSLRLIELPSLSYTYIAWNTLDPGAYVADRRARGCVGGVACEEDEGDILRLRRERPHPVLADPRVRRALTLAIDRRDLVEGLWGGHARTGATPILRSSWAWRDGMALPFDPREAAALLDEAGWSDTDGDGTRDRGGAAFELRVIVSSSNRVRIDALERVAVNLARVGVRLVLEPLPRAEFVARARDKAFDGACSGWWAGTRVEPQNLLHTRAAVDRGNNIASWSTPASDRLMEQAEEAPSRERALPPWAEWQRIFRDEQPFTILYVENRLLGLNASVGGPAPPFLNPFLGLRRWRVEP